MTVSLAPAALPKPLKSPTGLPPPAMSTMSASLAGRMRELAGALPAAIAQSAPDRAAALTAAEPGAPFMRLLRRARMHRHAAELQAALSDWASRRTDVWAVVELVEKLRAQRVFPMGLLKLHEHEWDTMLTDAQGGPQDRLIHFDAAH